MEEIKTTFHKFLVIRQYKLHFGKNNTWSEKRFYNLLQMRQQKIVLQGGKKKVRTMTTI